MSDELKPCPKGELLCDLRVFISEQAHWCEVAGGKADYQHQLIARIDEALASLPDAERGTPSIDDLQRDLQLLADSLGPAHDSIALIDHVIERLVCQDAERDAELAEARACINYANELHWDEDELGTKETWRQKHQATILAAGGGGG